MSNLTWHEHRVTREDRARLMGHGGSVVWFTGLSGSGKSTVANLVDERLHKLGVHTFLLDGDNVRMGLNPTPAELRPLYGASFADRFGVGFTADDRAENIRRVAAVAELFVSASIVTLTAFVSPYRRDRDAIRARLGNDFVEVFVDAPLEVCEQRDPKGLYKKARAGEIKNFTGISDPYEPPLSPEVHLAAGEHSPEELADQLVMYLKSTGRIA